MASLRIDVEGFPSHIAVKREGKLYVATCMQCGSFVGASASPSKVQLAVSQHKCETRKA